MHLLVCYDFTIVFHLPSKMHCNRSSRSWCGDYLTQFVRLFLDLYSCVEDELVVRNTPALGQKMCVCVHMRVRTASLSSLFGICLWIIGSHMDRHFPLTLSQVYVTELQVCCLRETPDFARC